MIIIDDKKYNELKSRYMRQRVSLINEEYLKNAISDSSWRFTRSVFEDMNIQLKPNQVGLLHIERLESINSREYEVGFKPNKTTIALWDNIDEVIDVPPNFTPPFSVQVLRNEPKVEEWGGVETTVNYDVKQYWPWGYDLERNIQIWKQR